MKRLLMTCSLVLAMFVSAGVVNATPAVPETKILSKTVTTTVTTTTQPIRNKIKDIRGHLKNHGPLRSIRNILRGLFNRDITPDPNVKEVVE